MYIWFIVWMFLLLPMAAGVYALLVRLMSPAVVQWLLLPGTIVSDVAYLVGTLVTGGGIRRGSAGGSAGEGAAPAGGGKFKTLGAIVSAMLSVVAVVAALVGAWTLLDKPVIKEFIGVKGAVGMGVALAPMDNLTQSGPSSASDVSNVAWEQAHNQVSLLRRLAGTLTAVNWLDWRVPLFVYLTLCLSIRLWPARRPIRPTLVAVILLTGIIAAIGALWKNFDSILQDIWPLLTYVWTSLLLSLILTLVITGVIALARALSGKGGAKTA